eukprot:TRINITY_DN7766_c0_g1_i5.p1 TRINITY_DN7766_c0_g1~~TRINITY_DN7766_c0_g1_i5.p1  ORF type:complete len:318 (-),score=30.10 TRINITY_DN7766_c0_g1_i5:144-1097(-)
MGKPLGHETRGTLLRRLALQGTDTGSTGDQIVTRQEGNTRLYDAGLAGKYAGLKNFLLKHEGENPTGSFKDRGMTCGATAAKMYKASVVACASTGNTSASMASYAAVSDMKSVIFIPEGKIAYGKLAQALAFNGKTLQIEGNFDDAMTLVQEVCKELNIYLLNSINPFRIEGQKAIGFEILQQLDWEVPDWFIIPGGNLGNNSALSKGLQELYQLGIINKIPRIAVIQASGANPLYTMWKEHTEFKAVKDPDTIATAIKIGNPVSWKKIHARTGMEQRRGRRSLRTGNNGRQSDGGRRRHRRGTGVMLFRGRSQETS